MLSPHQVPKRQSPSTFRGSFWIPGDRTSTPGGEVQRGPMFVHWEVKDRNTSKPPLILIHGGGGQGTDWTITIDGQPSWAEIFVEEGYPVYVVDRVGFGRSPYHPEVLGEMGPQITYEAAFNIFAPSDNATRLNPWSGAQNPGSPEIEQFVAALGPMHKDFAGSQEMDADRLGKLLDLTGPAVLITHSAGGPVGWVANDRHSDKVISIVALEPMGPAFAHFPGLGALQWGLTAAPVRYAPQIDSPGEALLANPVDLKMPSLHQKDVLVVYGGASTSIANAPEVLGFLTNAGADVDYVYLPDHGIHGNGHAIQMESNAAETITPVLSWLRSHLKE